MEIEWNDYKSDANLPCPPFLPPAFFSHTFVTSFIAFIVASLQKEFFSVIPIAKTTLKKSVKFDYYNIVIERLLTLN